MTDLLPAALKYAAKGRAVFPCNADKSPRAGGGFKAATTDTAILEMWQRDGLWNSDGMLGAVIPDGQVVIDIDPRNGGTATMAELTRDHSLPITRTARTRSGGTHLYFAVPEGVELRSSLGPGVDVKKPGKGYVIVPPSEGYTWEVPTPPCELPDWLLLELVVEPKQAAASAPSEAKFFDWQGGTAYGLSALEREVGRVSLAGPGERNNTLNRAAFALAQLAAGGELDDDRARDALLEAALKIGLELEESRKTIMSGWEAGEQEPRQAPKIDPLEDKFGSREPLGERETRGQIPPEVEAEAEGRFWVDWDIDEEAPPFYLDPVLPKNAYVLVFGPTEASKSMAWVGMLVQGSNRGLRSSVYSLENPPATDRDRLRRWVPKPDKRNFRLTNQPIDFNDPRQVEALIARESEFGTDVILLDTYSHCFNSRSDDGNAKAVEFARRVRYVMARVGCSVVVIDHTGYAHDDEPRDASAKRQQVDVAILMNRRGEWHKGEPSRFKMTNKKSARFANPFAINGEVRDLPDRGLELKWDAGQEPKWEER